MGEPREWWIRKPEGDAAIVFVHGVLSKGETCWANGDTWWPDLAAAEKSLDGTGIYVFSYRTSLGSGSYSISDAADLLNVRLDLDGLLKLRRLIFVCHSMGGIMARRFLCTRQTDLVRSGVRVGLFLVASPSLGSHYATLLTHLVKAFRHSQGEALRFAGDNQWLNDLDRDFQRLKESRQLVLDGQEIVEDRFIVLPLLFRKQVVEPFTGARYFADPLKIPGSDHFSIAKPENAAALQHRMLVQFAGRFLEIAARADAEAAARAAAGRLRIRRIEPAEEEWREFEGDHVTVGHGPRNQLVLDDPQVSWEHGVFAIEHAQLIYRHLSRTNPATVHGRGRQARLEAGGITEIELVNQDRIKIGAATFAVEFTAADDEGYHTTKKVPEG